MKDRIFVVVNGLLYPCIIGGAEIFAHSLSNELSKLRYDVTMLGYDRDGCYHMGGEGLGRRYRVSTSPSFGRFLDRLIVPLHTRNLIRGLEDGGKPIIISIMLHSSLLGYMIARKIRPKCHVISFSGGDAAISSMTGIWLERIRIDYFLYSKLSMVLNNPRSLFIATTSLMKKQMMKAGIRGNRIFIIPRLVEDRFFEVDPTDSILGGDRIIFVGRFSSEKGIQVLLRAFDIVTKGIPNVKLTLLGEGPLKGMIRRYVERKNLSRNMEIVGKVPYEHIHKYLADSTLFVLPSLNEGLPNALLQAMAAGLPIIASKVGGIPEAVRDEVDGILVNPGSPSELANEVLKLLEDRKRSLKLGRNARISAERYRADKVVEKYVELFESYCSGNGQNERESEERGE